VPDEVARLDLLALHRVLRLLAAHAHAMARYRPQPCPGGATLILSEDTVRKDPGLAKHWRAAFGGPVEEWTVPGDHLSIMAADVPALAERLGAALREGPGQTGGLLVVGSGGTGI
jgi:thioesterase domain-containing protein